jgi:hypothetical protein
MSFDNSHDMFATKVAPPAVLPIFANRKRMSFGRDKIESGGLLFSECSFQRLQKIREQAK